jgi:tetratricopeptide (TPR) repeat protein
MNLLEKLAKNYYIALPVVILVVYIRIITFDFTGFGDDVIILDNFERISNFTGLITEFSKTYPGGDDYKPLTMVSFYLNAAFSGQSTYFYHLTNIILHGLVCLLLFRFLILLNLSKPASFIGSLIFAIHPLIAGNIALISSRSILLMTAFGLLTMIYCIKYFNDRSSVNIWISGLFVLLSMLADFSGFAFTFLVIAYSVVFHNREFKDNFNIIIAPLLSVVIIWFLLYLNVDFSGAGNIFNPESGILLISGVYINPEMFKLLPEIAGKFLLPFSISPLPIFSALSIIIGIAVLLTFSILPFIIAKESKNFKYSTIFGLFILLFGVIFASVTLINVSSELYDYLTRFTYLPLIGIVILVSALISEMNFNYSNKFSNVGILLVFAILSFINFFNLNDYKSELTFIESASKINLENQILKAGLIEIYLKKGYIDKATNILENIDKYDKNNAETFLKIGDYYYKNKNYDDAIKYLEQVRALDSLNKPNLNILVNSHFMKKDYDKATVLLASIAADTARFPEARWDLFNMYIESQKFVQAGEFGKKAFTSEDDILRALQMVESWSKVFFKENDNVAVVKVMKTGLELDPENVVILDYLYETYSSIGLKEKAREYDLRLKKIFNEQNMRNK